ncbi:MAG: phenylalanine--tRNA ligase subunit alpha, partial [Alphaproteobacteria bacterium]|nr:phenylalanine--tRNA ligase subunit alpha [Alphaproteobacteria bacterium]
MESAEKLSQDTLDQITKTDSLEKLEDVRLAILGKKGKLTSLMKTLGSLSPDERKNQGAALNQIKTTISAALDIQKEALEEKELNARLSTEKIDITLPIRPEASGAIHPITQTMDEVIALFGDMGFEVEEGPDIEDDFHNFSALNIPEAHPARQEHDTFYLPKQEEKSLLLRTHTSPVQIRTMREGKPPFRIIALGRVYRSDYDMTHTPMFHQVEGLLIDKKINMGHLKGCLIDFCRRFFECDDLPVRFRPSYFPFT